MLAVTYRLDTGALSTFIRGIALAAIIVFAVVACATGLAAVLHDCRRCGDVRV